MGALMTAGSNIFLALLPSCFAGLSTEIRNAIAYGIDRMIPQSRESSSPGTGSIDGCVLGMRGMAVSLTLL